MAVGWPLIIRILKYTLGLSTIGGTAVLINGLINWNHEPVYGEPLNFEAMVVDIDVPVNIKNPMKCIKSPSKEFCFLTERKQMVHAIKANFQVDSNSAKSRRNSQINMRHHPVYDTIQAFCLLMKSLSIPVVLIEPSLLFCMLSADMKKTLLSKGFDLPAVMGTSNILTFAVRHWDIHTLQELRGKLESDDFTYFRIERDPPEWFESLGNESFTTHYLFTRRMIVVHLVVFYAREQFLWYGGIDRLPADVKSVITKDKLLFVQADGIFEKFSTRGLGSNEVRECTELVIPSDSTHFLLQIQSSRFIECKGPYSLMGNKMPTFVPSLNLFNRLKVAVWPHYSTFVLFKETLVGWYRDCKFTSSTKKKLDLVAKASDLKDFDLELAVRSSIPCSKNMAVFGSPELAYEIQFDCAEIAVHLYFLYEIDDVYISVDRRSDPDNEYAESWFGIYNRFTYPIFDVCSSEISGHKVLIPCDPEEILFLEYGPEWRRTIRDWGKER